MSEAAFCNCSAEDYINIDTDVQTEPDTMDNALVQNFGKSQKEREEEEEEEEEEKNDIVLEEEKCKVKAYQVQSEGLSGCCQKFKGTAGICRTTE